MLQTLANVVDHPLTRMAASLVGLAAIVFLALFGIVVALTPKTGWMLAVLAGGLVGLAGWWLRVFIRLPVLAAYPPLRWTVCSSLAIGIAAFTYTVLAWPDAHVWRQFLYPIGCTGFLLFVGSLATPATGIPSR